MRLSHRGETTVHVDAPPRTIVDDITTVELRHELVDGLLDPESDDVRWILPGLQVAGIGVRAAACIRVTVEAHQPERATVRIVGDPVPGFTPCALDIVLTAVPSAHGGSDVHATFGVDVELKLPRIARPIAQRVLDHEVARVRDTLVARIADHYGDVVPA
ncbi:MAG: hypothetical protein ACLGIR_06590 [Actinomycetes bacterium]